MSLWRLHQTHLRILLLTLNYSSTRPRTTGYEPLRLKAEPTIYTCTFVCQVEVIVTEKCLNMLSNYPSFCRVSDGSCRTSPIETKRLQKQPTAIWDRAGWVWLPSPSPSSMAQTMHNGYLRWPYFATRSKCIVSSKDIMTGRKRQQQTRPLQRRPLSKTGWIAIVLPDWLSCWAWSRGFNRNRRSSKLQRCFGRSSQTADKSKLNLNVFEIGEDLWSIKLQDCGDVDNYASRIDWKVEDYNLCAGPLTTDTDTDADTAKTIANMSEQEHIFYLLRWIPRNN